MLCVLAAGCSGSDDGNTAGDLDGGDETSTDDSAAGETSDNDGSTDGSTADDSTADDGSTGDSTSGGDTGGTSDSSTTGDAKSDTGSTGDGAATDSAKSDGGGVGLPTVTITLPTAAQILAFDAKSDVCQGQAFTVDYTAPLGFSEMKWRFITPKATSGVTGTCDGLAAYGYFMEQDKYVGSKAGAFSENVAIAGLYKDATSNGRWWWCTRPGTGVEAFASLSSPATTAPGAPGSPGYQTLSNYCYSNTKGAVPTDPTQQWTFEVTLKDGAGNTVVATQKFWIHN
ncbi:MAG: hypothetical protein ACXVEF_06550 [Polyangiales bacterium]